MTIWHKYNHWWKGDIFELLEEFGEKMEPAALAGDLVGCSRWELVQGAPQQPGIFYAHHWVNIELYIYQIVKSWCQQPGQYLYSDHWSSYFFALLGVNKDLIHFPSCLLVKHNCMKTRKTNAYLWASSFQNWERSNPNLVKIVTCRSSSLASSSSSSPSSSTVTTSASPTILPTTSQTPSGLDVEASVWSTKKKKTIAVAVVVRISIEGGTSPAGSKFPAVHTSKMAGVQNSCNFESFFTGYEQLQMEIYRI